MTKRVICLTQDSMNVTELLELTNNLKDSIVPGTDIVIAFDKNEVHFEIPDIFITVGKYPNKNFLAEVMYDDGSAVISFSGAQERILPSQYERVRPVPRVTEMTASEIVKSFYPGDVDSLMQELNYPDDKFYVVYYGQHHYISKEKIDLTTEQAFIVRNGYKSIEVVANSFEKAFDWITSKKDYSGEFIRPLHRVSVNVHGRLCAYTSFSIYEIIIKEFI